MLKIVLCCQNGASTALLKNYIKAAGEKKKLDLDINAYSFDKLDSVIGGADIVLFGPQVRYLMKDMEKKYKKTDVRMMVIDTIDYGMLDGEAILNKALAVLNK